MKIVKRLIATMLVFVTTLTGSYTALASPNQNDDATPYYVNISSADAYMTTSGIKTTCSASLSSKRSLSLKIKMEHQKKKSSGYETVETWSSSKTGTYLSMSESRNINILCDYRLKVTFTAGSETEVVYRY